MRRLATVLWQLFRRESQLRGDEKWASHQAGRHAGLSGRWFLEALRTRQGQQAAAASALAFRLPLAAILQAHGAPLDDEVMLQLLSAFRGVLLQGAPATKQASGAGDYNAMDAGRSVWSWAVCSGRVADAPLTQPVYEMLERSQQPPCREQLMRWGISSAATFEMKRRALQQAVHGAPTFDGHDGRRLDPPQAGSERWRLDPPQAQSERRRLDPPQVLWPNVFIYACEMAQAIGAIRAM